MFLWEPHCVGMDGLDLKLLCGLSDKIQGMNWTTMLGWTEVLKKG